MMRLTIEELLLVERIVGEKSGYDMNLPDQLRLNLVKQKFHAMMRERFKKDVNATTHLEINWTDSFGNSNEPPGACI